MRKHVVASFWLALTITAAPAVDLGVSTGGGVDVDAGATVGRTQDGSSVGVSGTAGAAAAAAGAAAASGSARAAAATASTVVRRRVIRLLATNPP